MSVPMQKLCLSCREVKPLCAFHRLSKSSDGHRAKCKACRQPDSRDRHQRLRAVINQRSAAWRAANRERHLFLIRRWTDLHRQTLRAAERARRRDNPEPFRAKDRTAVRREHNRHNSKYQMAKRRLQKGAAVERISQAEWRDIQAGYSRMCVYCYKQPARLTMDHLVPLSSGGWHVPENITPACRSCNSAKGAKSLVAFLIARRGEQNAAV